MKVVDSDLVLNKESSMGKPLKTSKGLLYYIKRDFLLYIMLIIPLAYILTFKYGSMYGIQIAFKDYNMFQGVSNSPWNNFTTFKQIFASPQFFQVVRNTLVLNGLDLIVVFRHQSF